jgi:hypothetical protein
MNRKSVTAIGLLIVIIVVAAIVVAFTRMSGTPNVQPTAIRIEPENVGKLAVNSTFTVNVTVENCVDIYAVQVDIRYDPQVLNATIVSEGPFLPSTGPTSPINTFNQTVSTKPLSARVFFVDLKTGQSLPDANGNGILFTITFQVLTEGSSQLQIYPYPGSGVTVGTYFMKRDNTEIIPELHGSSYGLFT